MLQRTPRLVAFFISYVIGTCALPQHEISLKQALQVAQQAKLQLPLTGHIGLHIPDKLAKCLKEVFGSRSEQDVWAPASGPETTAESVLQPGATSKVFDNDGGIDVVPSEESLWANADSSIGWGASDAGEWGQPVGAWGDPADGWGMDMDVDIAAKSTAWMSTVYNLMELLGPTTLPLTHTIGYVEESTRSIAKISIPPREAQVKDPLEAFAKIELKPYARFAGPSEPYAVVQKPKLLEDPHKSGKTSSATSMPVHDPEKDTITILVEAELAERIQEAVGIGLKGVFVQVVPKPASESGSRAKAKAKGGNRVLWYAEKLHQIIPSFWTELGEYEKVMD